MANFEENMESLDEGSFFTPNEGQVMGHPRHNMESNAMNVHFVSVHSEETVETGLERDPGSYGSGSSVHLIRDERSIDGNVMDTGLVVMVKEGEHRYQPGELSHGHIDIQQQQHQQTPDDSEPSSLPQSAVEQFQHQQAPDDSEPSSLPQSAVEQFQHQQAPDDSEPSSLPQSAVEQFQHQQAPDDSEPSALPQSAVQPSVQEQVQQQVPPDDSASTSQDAMQPSNIDVESFIFTCPFCFQRYKNAEDLKVHLPTHMEVKLPGADENKEKAKADHQCGECEKAFDSYDELQKHLQVHKDKVKEGEDFRCNICGKQFRTRYGLSNHASVHKLDEHRCNISKQFFMDEESLLNHSLEHTKVKKELLEEGQLETVAVKLDDSGGSEVISDKATLRDAENQVKSNKIHGVVGVEDISQDGVDMKTYNYKCEFCGKLFKRKVLYTIHLRTHTGEKPFTCRHCPKAFARKYALVYHERIHTGEKPHKCTQCDKAFNTPSSLHAHNRVHTGQKPYCCLDCGRKFALRSSLRVHQSVHMVTRDFACEMCSKTFTTRKYLNRHLKKCPMVARNKHKCSRCCEAFPTKTRLASHTLTCKNVKTEKVEENKTLDEPSDNGSADGKSIDINQNSDGKKDLQCKFCPRICAKPCLLIRHERIHTGEKPFKCQYCPQCFSRKENVPQHERIHTGELPYSCQHCDRSYRTASGCKDHQKSHLRCSVCRKKFKNIRAAETHESTHKLAYTCVKCDQRFRTKRLLDCHARTHEENAATNFECGMCKEVFGTKASLTRHRMDYHESDDQGWPSGSTCCDGVIKTEPVVIEGVSDQSIDEKIVNKDQVDEEFYQCSYCGKRETSLFRLEKHERTHTDERPYSCIKCSKGYVRKDVQNLHESDCSFAGKLPCNMCNRTFKSEAALKSHQRSHERKGPVHCKYCEDVFDTVDELSQHEKDHVRVKGKNKPHKFQCGFCSKTFPKDCRRIVHERSHTGEKPYSCTLCTKRFARKDTLRVHIWTHSKSKPFSCQVCDRTFTLKSNLNAHLKNVHDVDQAYSCQECGKSFRKERSLRQHKLLHGSSVVYNSSLKVYVCQHCEQSFKRLKIFAKHLQKEHEEYWDDMSGDDVDDHGGDDDDKDADYVPEEDIESRDSTKEQTSFQCSFCGKTESSIYDLESHERTHTEERPYVCKKCSKGFVREAMLMIHEKDCYRKQLKCVECDKIFKNQATYKSHNKTHEQKEHLCSVCGVVTATHEELKRHRKTHAPDVLRNYYCTECPKSFTHKNSLGNHIDTCHRDPTRPKCAHCGETFVNEGWLRQHMYVYHYEVLVVEQQMRSQNQPNISAINVSIQQGHHQEDSDNGKAPTGFENLHLQSTMDCIETLAAFSSLQGETLQQVSGKSDGQPDMPREPHGTDILQVEFSTHSKQVCSENERVEFNTGSSDRDGQCMEDLNLQQLGESQMVSDVQQDTTVNVGNEGSQEDECEKGEEGEEGGKPAKDVKKYPCKMCMRRFRKKSELRNHTRTHTGERPYLCNQCGKSFKVLSGLKAHEDRHLGLKRYKCTECTKAYANPSGLREHMDAHKGIKRYQCLECPKSFRQRQSLKEHLDVHRGFRQYQCDSCPRSFSQRRSWRMHMRTHGKMV